MEIIFMDTENSKTNEPHKFVYNVSQRLDLRSLDSNVAAQSLSIYYTWKNVRTINLEKKLQLGMMNLNCQMVLIVSHIQDYIEFIIQKHEILTTIPPIHVYINRINNRLVFKIKDGYKLELEIPGTMKLFGSKKKLKDKTKIGENIPSLEVVEVVLVNVI